jgi:hypothetical protein
MNYDFILRSVIIEFDCFGTTLFVRCSCQYMPVWARYNHGPVVHNYRSIHCVLVLEHPVLFDC